MTIDFRNAKKKYELKKQSGIFPVLSPVIRELHSLYQVIDQQTKVVEDTLDRKCLKCSSCCTSELPITIPEGIMILNHVHNTYTPQLRAGLLLGLIKIVNDAGKIPDNEIPCPFLIMDKSCSIYNVRPFGCRTFGVTKWRSKTIDYKPNEFSWNVIDSCLMHQKFFKSKPEIIDGTDVPTAEDIRDKIIAVYDVFKDIYTNNKFDMSDDLKNTFDAMINEKGFNRLYVVLLLLYDLCFEPKTLTQKSLFVNRKPSDDLILPKAKVIELPDEIKNRQHKKDN